MKSLFEFATAVANNRGICPYHEKQKYREQGEDVIYICGYYRADCFPGRPCVRYLCPVLAKFEKEDRT